MAPAVRANAHLPTAKLPRANPARANPVMNAAGTSRPVRRASCSSPTSMVVGSCRLGRPRPSGRAPDLPEGRRRRGWVLRPVDVLDGREELVEVFEQVVLLVAFGH